MEPHHWLPVHTYIIEIIQRRYLITFLCAVQATQKIITYLEKLDAEPEPEPEEEEESALDFSFDVSTVPVLTLKGQGHKIRNGLKVVW